MGLIENAIAQVTANVKAVAQRIDDGGAYGSALANVGDSGLGTAGKSFSTLVVDYTTITFNTAVQTFNIAGDWLYVDPASVGAPPFSLLANFIDDIGMVLNPGRVVQSPFRAITVNFVGGWNNVPQTLQIIGPAIDYNGLSKTPRLIVHYGTGPCPFEAVATEFSRSPVTMLFQQEGASPQIFSVPAGCTFDLFLNVTQTTTVAGLGYLYANLTNAYSLSAQIPPDYSQQLTQSAPGPQYALFTFRNVKAIRQSNNWQVNWGAVFNVPAAGVTVNQGYIVFK
jgi:hypothetical protein